MVKFVLCISGGGVRGAASASFLQELEKMIEKEIYDTFDMFAGTSTGSLIVGALSYEKMSGEKINNELYSNVNSQKIMDKSYWDKIAGTMQTKPKYTNEGLKEVIDNVLTGEKLFSDTEKDTLVTAFDVDNFKPVIFKSFNNKHNISVKSVLCMSSAAPAYFPTFHDKDSDMWCIDGGVTGMNDPSEAAYAEAIKLYGKHEDIRILSIGTGFNYTKGKGEESKNYGGLEWLTKGNLIDITMSGPQQAVKYKMGVFTEALGHKYLHVDGKLENTSMDDVSPENIKILKDQGKLWFEKYKEQIKDLLN